MLVTVKDPAVPTVKVVALALVSVGAWLTLIVKICGAEVSLPPLAVPPLSFSTTVSVAVPLVCAAGVYVSTPVGATAGPAAKSPGLVLFVIWNVSVCPASLGGPALMAVAHGLTVCGPALTSTV